MPALDDQNTDINLYTETVLTLDGPRNNALTVHELEDKNSIVRALLELNGAINNDTRTWQTASCMAGLGQDTSDSGAASVYWTATSVGN